METDPTAASSTYYRIEQVAARTGLTKRTLRYYEEIGLLDPQTRSEGNYRLYSEADLARLERICRIKNTLGLTLAETRELVALEEKRGEIRAQFQQAPDATTRLEQLDQAEAIVRQQLALIETKLQSLNQMHADALAQLDRYAQVRAEFEAQRHADQHGD